MFAILKLLAASLLVSTAAYESTSGRPGASTRVGEVVVRSKTTRATYALYTWIRMAKTGEPVVEEWSAEFNAGRYHRVETPRDRLVADCEAMTGTALRIPTGEVYSGREVAAAACGIDSNPEVALATWDGEFPSPFGKVDRIRLTNEAFIRIYDVNGDGVIVRADILYNTPGARPTLQTLSTDLFPKIPAGDMFSRESLSVSFVPEAYKAGPVGHRWSTP